MMEGPRHQHLHQEWQEPLEEPTDPENKSTKAKQHVAQVHAPRETERQLIFFLLPFGRDTHTLAGCACLLPAKKTGYFLTSARHMTSGRVVKAYRTFHRGPSHLSTSHLGCS